MPPVYRYGSFIDIHLLGIGSRSGLLQEALGAKIKIASSDNGLPDRALSAHPKLVGFRFGFRLSGLRS